MVFKAPHFVQTILLDRFAELPGFVCHTLPSKMIGPNPCDIIFFLQPNNGTTAQQQQPALQPEQQQHQIRIAMSQQQQHRI